MRTVTRIVSTTLAGVALAGFAGVAGGGAAHASGAPANDAAVSQAGPAADGEMRAESTRRFTITNLTDRTLRVRTFASTWGNDPTPPAGTAVPPGGELPVEVTWWFGYDQNVTAVLDVLGDDGAVIGRADVTMRLGNWAQPSSFGFAGNGLRVDGNGYDVRVVDATPTVHEVPADQPDLQSAILNRWVATGKADVTVTPTGQPDRRAWSAPYISGDEIIANRSSEKATQTITNTSAQSQSTNLAVAASLKLAFGSMVEASLTTTLGHEWSTTTTFSTSTTVTAAPDEFAWLEARNPVVRVTADVRVTVGNTTWVLRGVTFDTPDASRKALAIPRSRAMTAQETADLGPGLHVMNADTVTL